MEIFDQLEDYGDPFVLLSSLEPDDKNLPFRVCIGDLASEYCKYTVDEAFCLQVPKCAKQQVSTVVIFLQTCIHCLTTDNDSLV